MKKPSTGMSATATIVSQARNAAPDEHEEVLAHERPGARQRPVDVDRPRRGARTRSAMRVERADRRLVGAGGVSGAGGRSVRAASSGTAFSACQVASPSRRTREYALARPSASHWRI